MPRKKGVGQKRPSKGKRLDTPATVARKRSKPVEPETTSGDDATVSSVIEEMIQVLEEFEESERREQARWDARMTRVYIRIACASAVRRTYASCRSDEEREGFLRESYIMKAYLSARLYDDSHDDYCIRCHDYECDCTSPPRCGGCGAELPDKPGDIWLDDSGEPLPPNALPAPPVICACMRENMGHRRTWDGYCYYLMG